MGRPRCTISAMDDNDPVNPFMRALTFIVIGGLVLGVIFVFIGASNPLMGTGPFLVLGYGLLGIAGTAILVELGAAAARWQPPIRPERPSLSEVRGGRDA